MKSTGKKDSELFKTIEFWKDRIEFIFIAFMSALLIYIFNPRVDRTKYINYETRLLFYLFGFILILTANWKIFFKESPLFKDLQKVVSNK